MVLPLIKAAQEVQVCPSGGIHPSRYPRGQVRGSRPSASAHPATASAALQGRARPGIGGASAEAIIGPIASARSDRRLRCPGTRSTDAKAAGPLRRRSCQPRSLRALVFLHFPVMTLRLHATTMRRGTSRTSTSLRPTLPILLIPGSHPRSARLMRRVLWMPLLRRWLGSGCTSMSEGESRLGSPRVRAGTTAATTATSAGSGWRRTREPFCGAASSLQATAR